MKQLLIIVKGGLLSFSQHPVYKNDTSKHKSQVNNNNWTLRVYRMTTVLMVSSALLGQAGQAMQSSQSVGVDPQGRVSGAESTVKSAKLWPMKLNNGRLEIANDAMNKARTQYRETGITIFELGKADSDALCQRLGETSPVLKSEAMSLLALVSDFAGPGLGLGAATRPTGTLIDGSFATPQIHADSGSSIGAFVQCDGPGTLFTRRPHILSVYRDRNPNFEMSNKTREALNCERNGDPSDLLGGGQPVVMSSKGRIFVVAGAQDLYSKARADEKFRSSGRSAPQGATVTLHLPSHRSPCNPNNMPRLAFIVELTTETFVKRLSPLKLQQNRSIFGGQ